MSLYGEYRDDSYSREYWTYYSAGPKLMTDTQHSTIRVFE